MDPKTLNGMGELAMTPLRDNLGMTSRDDESSWFRALAEAWGQSLDNQAEKITDMADQIGQGGEERPSDLVALTAESLRMQFLSNSQNTSTNAVGQALETMARKQ
ncbi:MAG: hypothetical protein AAGJ50_14165 [Pseudomonadota bacterium]